MRLFIMGFLNLKNTYECKQDAKKVHKFNFSIKNTLFEKLQVVKHSNICEMPLIKCNIYTFFNIKNGNHQKC